MRWLVLLLLPVASCTLFYRLFTPQDLFPRFEVGVAPSAVVMGDFNGDSLLDLAVANHDSNNVSVLFGSGDGAFLPQQTFDVGVSPTFVAQGDFNGDAALDLAVTNADDNTVSILLGVGGGN